MMSKNSFFVANNSVISDSDLGQAIVRLFVGASAILMIAYFETNSSNKYLLSNPSQLFATLLGCYVILSFVITLVTLRILPNCTTLHTFRRIISVIIDLAIAGIGFHFTEEYSLIMFSVMLSIVIGYGFRFGLGYLIFSVTVGMFVVIALANFSPYFSTNIFLTYGLLVGIVLVPTYAASLLAKYQKVLVELDETNRARARFIANMSHELRTPLHAIAINADEILSQNIYKDELPVVTKKALGVIRESSNHLKNLVDRVLDIASHDAGVFELGEPEDIDLFRLLSSSIEIGATNARKNSVKVHLCVSPSTPRSIIGWQQHLMEALLNVIGNAAKFTTKGEIVVRSWAVRDPESILRISISDTGKGMSEEELAAAFEPFVLGDDSRSRRFEGTGIGLTLTKQYIESMGGTIEMRSIVGQGTVATIALPIRDVEEFDYGNDTNTDSIIFVTETGSLSSDQFVGPGIANVEVIPKASFFAQDLEIKSPDCFVIDVKIEDEVREFVNRSELGKLSAPLVIFCNDNPLENPIQPPFRCLISEITAESLSDIRALISTPQKLLLPPLGIEKPKRILIIDDNQNNLDSAMMVLENAGHDIEFAISGQDGIKKIIENNYDLVLVDMHMPGMSGIQTVEEARKQIGKVLPPIVFLTADVTKKAQDDAAEVGAAGFLGKPVLPAALRVAVQKYCLRTETTNRIHSSAGLQKKTDTPEMSSRFPELHDMLVNGTASEKLFNLIDSFHFDFSRLIVQCCVASAAGDVENVNKLIHKMRGSASAMHFADLLAFFHEDALSSSENVCEAFLGKADELQSVVNLKTKDAKDYLCNQI